MKLRAPALALVVAASMLLAGCASDAGPASASDATVTSIQDVAGLRVLVVTDEWLPIAAASVEIPDLDAQALTDLLGVADLGRISPGTYDIGVKKVGYYAKQANVVVPAGKLVEVEFQLERIPVAAPPFEVAHTFHGNLTVGLMSEQEGATGQGVDYLDFLLAIPERSDRGDLLAAIYARITAASESAGAIDIDLYLLDPTHAEVERGSEGGAKEMIEHVGLLGPGDWTVRVVLWAGVAAEVDVDARLTYLSGEAAEVELRKAGS